MSRRNPRLTAKTAGQRPAKWYDVKNVSYQSADIYIYEEIGYWGVTAQDFVRELIDLRTNEINLHLNSPGGEVFDGIAIHGALKSHPATVNVYIDALAASAASFIAMAGDSISIMRNAQMMIHQGQGIVLGNRQDMLAMADLLEKTDANIADMYFQRAGGKLQSWVEAMEAETWYSAQEAVDAGLADAMIDSWEMSPEGVTPGDNAETYDPEYAWRERLAAITRYAGRSKAPEPYIPTTQQNSTQLNAPEIQPEPSPMIDVTSVIRELRNLKEVSK